MATTEIGGLRISLSLDSSSFLGGLVQAQRSLAAFAGRVEAQFARLNDSINRISARMTVAITLPAALSARMAVNAASSVAEMQSAFEYTFGKMADDVEAWAERTGDAIGRSTYELQQGALAFQQMFRVAAPTGEAAAGLSKQFALLTQDLSSFYNVTGDVALMKLRSALQGESEPIRDFGVFLTEAAVAQEAVSMGAAKTTKDVSEQAKILARANIILRETVTAQGDATRTAGSYENQVRALRSQFEELSVKIGKILLPFAEKLVTLLTRLVTWFSNLSETTHRVIAAVVAFAAALGPLLVVIKGLVVFFTARWIMSTFGVFGSILSYLIAPLQTLATTLGIVAVRLVSIQGLVSIASVVLKRLAGPVAVVVSTFLLFRDYIIPVLDQLWQAMQATLGPRLHQIFAALAELFGKLANGPVGTAITWLIGAIEVLFDVVSTVMALFVSETGQQLVKAFELVLITIRYVVEAISGLVDVVTGLLTGDWAKAWTAAGAVVDAVAGGWIDSLGVFSKEAEASLRSVYGSAKKWLVDEFGKLASGFSAIVDAIVSAFNNQFPEIASTAQWVYGEVEKWLVKAFGPLVEFAKWAAKEIGDAYVALKKRMGLGGDGGTGQSGDAAGAAAGSAIGGFLAANAKPRPAIGDDKKKKKGRSGPTDEDRRRNYDDELSRIEDRILDMQQELATNLEDRLLIAQKRAVNDLEAYDAEIDEKVKRKELTPKAGEELKLRNAMLRELQAQLHAREWDRELDEQALRIKRAMVDAETDLLRSRLDLARTAAERREIEMRMLEAQQKNERDELIKIRNSTSADDWEKEIAQTRIDQLDEIQRNQRERTRRDTAGPLESYLDNIPSTIGEINEQLEEMAVNRLKAIEDSFAGIAQKVLGVNGALGETLGMLLRIVAQQAILAASNGSGVGGFLSGVGSALGAAFGGGASPSPTAIAQSSAATAGNWSLSGWASGGGGLIKGLSGLDRNTLSMNGIPLARVSRGEMLSVTPTNDMGRRPSVMINADFRGASPEAVTAMSARLDQFEQNLPGMVIQVASKGKERRFW
ncbi:phage tail tape measure protein [Sphingomonas sanxanigenens]|uniref:phage tail tape measure protein n=1 Tax=Sphingomonas sanxanigenens TaxID=397260 RepID=UPI0004BB6358|nr:phage tail tape measure protein [Sphingomonas sanxanigenens]